MSDCNLVSTPVDTKAKLSATSGSPVVNPSLYRNLAGALQHTALTRPNIAYDVQQVCLHMHDPRQPCLLFIKRILRYLKGTLDLALTLCSSSSHNLIAYSHADLAGCPDTRCSTFWILFVSQ